MSALAEFQNSFAQALMAPPTRRGIALENIDAMAAQPGFSVYRNTVLKGCIDALQANYPAVARFTGEEWFRAAAAIYVRESPPDDPALVRYGASFATFLARFEPARELPCLPDVARLDRLWTESHIARDETTLDAAVIARLAPDKLATAVLYPHAAARWAWFADAPVFSIWARNRGNDLDVADTWQPEWKAEGVLLTRTHGAVEWIALDAASRAFLDQCANGGTLAQAAGAALTAQSDADLQQLMAALLRAGAFNRMSITRALIRINRRTVHGAQHPESCTIVWHQYIK